MLDEGARRRSWRNWSTWTIWRVRSSRPGGRGSGRKRSGWAVVGPDRWHGRTRRAGRGGGRRHRVRHGRGAAGPTRELASRGTSRRATTSGWGSPAAAVGTRVMRATARVRPTWSCGRWSNARVVGAPGTVAGWPARHGDGAPTRSRITSAPRAPVASLTAWCRVIGTSRTQAKLDKAVKIGPDLALQGDGERTPARRAS